MPVEPPTIGWPALRADLRRRMRDPFGNPTFIMYFAFNVVGIAGVGLWITLLRYGMSAAAQPLEGVFEAAATYAIAVSAVALADIILNKDTLGSFTMLSWGTTILVGASVAASFKMPVPLGDRLTACICVVGVLLSLMQWWMINTDNRALYESEDPTGTTGGDPLQPLSGDLKGYKT